MIGFIALTLASAALGAPAPHAGQGLAGLPGNIIRPEGFRPPSGFGTSNKVLNMRAVRDHPAGPSLYSHILRAKTSENHGGSEAELQSFEWGWSYAVDVKIGGQQFILYLDIGSSDTFVPLSTFKCVEQESGEEHPQADCAFGNLYTGNNFNPVPGVTFNTNYFIPGQYVNGKFGKVSVEVAGVEAEAQVAFGETAYWEGNSKVSGALGLAYPCLTKAYKEGAKEKSGGESVVYDPVFTTMWKQGIIDPVFTIALDRDLDGKGGGGTLTLGGVPAHVEVTGEVATVPIEIHQVDDVPLSSKEFSFYTVTIDKISLTKPKPIEGGIAGAENPDESTEGSPEEPKDPTKKSPKEPKDPDESTEGSPEEPKDPTKKSPKEPKNPTKKSSKEPKDPTVNEPTTRDNVHATALDLIDVDIDLGLGKRKEGGISVIVDTLTPKLFFPKKIIERIAKAFDPPPKYSKEKGSWEVNCDVKAPTLIFTFNGVDIPVASQDLIIESKNPDNGKVECYAVFGVSPLPTLGNPFLKNVMATFDIGASQIRFQSRK